MITLEQLAIYLPYRLKMIFLKSGRIKTLTGLNKEKNDLYFHFGIIRQSQILFNFRPIMHPLSDLTKPITVEGYNDGKEFMPIVELANMTLFDFDKRLFDPETVSVFDGKKIGLGGFCYSVDRKVPTENMGILDQSFCYDEGLERFAMRCNTRSRPLSFSPQFKLYQHMAKWHIWWGDQSLFETGEIIDINSLK